MSDHEGAVLDTKAVNTNWNGGPLQLLVNQSVTIPQTPNGTTIFAATNQATQNNAGQLVLTSGGGAPTTLGVPALSNSPTILINNWQANNLGVTNTSINNITPILVQAVGPGMPGIQPLTLNAGMPTQMAPGQCAQANASPQWMQLVLQVTGATLGVIGVIGGPQDASGNNAYAIQVNAPSNTGPGTGMTPPPGYYATTTSNTYTYQFNWGSSLIFVANLSPSTAQAVAATLRTL